MATEIHNHSNRGDNYAILWATLIVIAAVILGYIAYASYYRTIITAYPQAPAALWIMGIRTREQLQSQVQPQIRPIQLQEQARNKFVISV